MIRKIHVDPRLITPGFLARDAWTVLSIAPDEQTALRQAGARSAILPGDWDGSACRDGRHGLHGPCMCPTAGFVANAEGRPVVPLRLL